MKPAQVHMSLRRKLGMRSEQSVVFSSRLARCSKAVRTNEPGASPETKAPSGYGLKGLSHRDRDIQPARFRRRARDVWN